MQTPPLPRRALTPTRPLPLSGWILCLLWCGSWICSTASSSSSSLASPAPLLSSPATSAAAFLPGSPSSTVSAPVLGPAPPLASALLILARSWTGCMSCCVPAGVRRGGKAPVPTDAPRHKQCNAGVLGCHPSHQPAPPPRPHASPSLSVSCSAPYPTRKRLSLCAGLGDGPADGATSRPRAGVAACGEVPRAGHSHPSLPVISGPSLTAALRAGMVSGGRDAASTRPAGKAPERVPGSAPRAS